MKSRFPSRVKECGNRSSKRLLSRRCQSMKVRTKVMYSRTAPSREDPLGEADHNSVVRQTAPAGLGHASAPALRRQGGSLLYETRGVQCSVSADEGSRG